MLAADTPTEEKSLLFNEMTSFTYSYFDGLEYSDPLSNDVTPDEALDDIAVPTL